MKRPDLFALLLLGAALLCMLTVYITQGVVVSRNPFTPIEENPNLTGTIVQMDKKLDSVLVIGGLLEEDRTIPVNDLLKSGKYPNVYWISNVNTRRFQLGDMVDVWFNEALDSYPAQTSAVKIKKTDS
ncbi:YobA family protein [Paenibacillus sp. sptzw28]|uniref:DUF3221 domain-containing protein n=1 Tax=Paenibacillus sp. sptzw28 TaxID=715179 RepID=UPI001C6E8E87|nr:DUF3221 domain-containing protein [Paenibacillus sp. sptzw28]QYR21288.1 YobA family protein [Paenibacillus sp. sptzw28]